MAHNENEVITISTGSGSLSESDDHEEVAFEVHQNPVCSFYSDSLIELLEIPHYMIPLVIFLLF